MRSTLFPEDLPTPVVTYDWQRTLGRRWFSGEFCDYMAWFTTTGGFKPAFNLSNFFELLIKVSALISVLVITGVISGFDWLAFFPSAILIIIKVSLSWIFNADLILLRHIVFQPGIILSFLLAIVTVICSALSMGGNPYFACLFIVYVPISSWVSLTFESLSPEFVFQNRHTTFINTAFVDTLLLFLVGLGIIPTQMDLVFNFGYVGNLSRRAVSLSSVQSATNGLLALSILSWKEVFIGFSQSRANTGEAVYHWIALPVTGMTKRE